MDETKKGKLIFLDGPDGSGKTTQLELTRIALQNAGHSVYTARINGGTPFGEELRTVVLSDSPRDPLTEHYVFMAMHNQLRIELMSHLQAGEIILIDRSPLSDWAYQKFGGQLDSTEFDRDLDQSLALFKPDLIICYKLRLDTMQTRIQKRREGAKLDYFESKPAHFFQRVITGYEFASGRYGAVTIDAEQPIDAVHYETMRCIDAVLQ